MKKTYNVISKNVLKFSVMFCFTLFFLGMSSSVSAQLASSRASAGSAADVDLSLTQKAQIGVSEEIALEILETEMLDARNDAKRDLTPQQEAENSARLTFLGTVLNSYNDKNMELVPALVSGHLSMMNQAAQFSNQIQQVVDFEGIVREYVDRLK